MSVYEFMLVYPTMHFFGIVRYTQSVIAYKILNEYKLGLLQNLALRELTVVNMPYS